MLRYTSYYVPQKDLRISKFCRHFVPAYPFLQLIIIIVGGSDFLEVYVFKRKWSVESLHWYRVDKPCRQTHILSEIRKGRSRWLEHMKWMPEERTMKKVFSGIPKGKSFFGNPRKIWLDDVENYQNKINVRGWSRTANDTDARRFFLNRGHVSTWKSEPVENTCISRRLLALSR